MEATGAVRAPCLLPYDATVANAAFAAGREPLALGVDPHFGMGLGADDGELMSSLKEYFATLTTSVVQDAGASAGTAAAGAAAPGDLATEDTATGASAGPAAVRPPRTEFDELLATGVLLIAGKGEGCREGGRAAVGSWKAHWLPSGPGERTLRPRPKLTRNGECEWGGRQGLAVREFGVISEALIDEFRTASRLEVAHTIGDFTRKMQIRACVRADEARI